jgi:hypothetical protein
VRGATFSPFLRLLYPPASSLSTANFRKVALACPEVRRASCRRFSFALAKIKPAGRMLAPPPTHCHPERSEGSQTSTQAAVTTLNTSRCVATLTPNTPVPSAAKGRALAQDPDPPAANSDPPSPASPASAVSLPALPAVALDRQAAPAPAVEPIFAFQK